MFSEILSGFSKFATPQRLLILIIFVVLAMLLLSYSEGKGFSMDGMETGTDASAGATGAATGATGAAGAAGAVPSSTMPAAATGATITSPSELLPADQNSQWAALNPVNMSQGNIIAGDMLQAGYHIGLDTIGQTLKNANLQLRSDPIIPKQTAGPWNQSTYEPDYGRVPLEIGSGAP